MRTPPVIRERRTLEGRGKISTSARSGPTRKRRSAKSLRSSRKHRLRGFWLVSRGLYGWDLARELGHHHVVPPALLGSGLSFSVQLLPKVAYLVLQRGNELRLIAWYAAVGRLVRLRRTTPQQHVHGPALFCGGQRAALYPAADSALSYAKCGSGLGDG
jgi:hypothetical protein